MVTKIKTDEDTFIARKKDETFLVDANADLVFLNSTVGINASGASGGRTIRIDGSISTPLAGSNAIQIDCSAKTAERIIVGSTGEVSADNAISASGGRVDIRVAGRVDGGINAIGLNCETAALRNSGIIQGGTGTAVNLLTEKSTMINSGQIIGSTGPAMRARGDCTVVNSGDIQVDGPDTISILVLDADFDLKNTGNVLANSTNSIAIRILSAVGNTHIVNEGTIAGNGAAIVVNTQFSGDALEIVNTGEIFGDIKLTQSARNDLVDTSNGRVEGDIFTGAGSDRILLVNAVVTGAVAGGLGDDVYTVSSNGISIGEDANAGTDTVRATGNVSITLAANFENLVLIGKNDTQATGNGVDNVLTGNSGNNIIDGAAGEDTIRGGKGRDELVGGGDADTFIFRKGDGKDLIGDFDTASGHDFLDLSTIKGITDFDDLIDNHATDVDGDVVINAGKGDQVVLEGLTIAELRAELFFL